MQSWRIGVLLVMACGRFHFDPTGGASAQGSCTNAIRDGQEQGIDCGGGCLDCPGASCSSDATCATAHCVDGLCELASAPPYWEPGPDLLTLRTEVDCATGVNGELYVVGGGDGVTAALTSTEILMPGATNFVPGPSTNTAHAGHAVATLDGIVYAFAGRIDATMSSGTLEALVGGTWMMRTGTVGAHLGVAAAAADGHIYVEDNDNTWIYTPAMDSWLVSYTPDIARDEMALATGSDGVVYELGGDAGATPQVDLVDAWQPTTASWSPRSPMTIARRNPAAVAAPDGRIYVIGGLSGAARTATAECYTPQRDRWVGIPPLAVARDKGGAALGFDGRVYAIGGAGSTSAPLRSVEIYGPRIDVTPATSAVGATVTLAGDNFAANAAVAVTLDGTPIASGVTDEAGHVVTELVVPAVASGAHAVVAIDSKSQYPTTATLSVP